MKKVVASKYKPLVWFIYLFCSYQIQSEKKG